MTKSDLARDMMEVPDNPVCPNCGGIDFDCLETKFGGASEEFPEIYGKVEDKLICTNCGSVVLDSDYHLLM
jgi:ribosomal protein S27AE